MRFGTRQGSKCDKICTCDKDCGQESSYLAEFLLERGYEIHDIKRRASQFDTQRIDRVYLDPQVHNSRIK